ncbi:glutathione S-transferase family protein [Stakelama tenebrarum]|uniref:Glutathione S-transferase family protein n=1 Tax=Stakelama tenebrarum TaxID=2711215 RepID=A0A6G6Y9I3_9SPHN|nr:glutathione S-transferase family protein [Sphingosinithalassobacter tenebrarum]QIG81579.1 glutathione S-transferase family protein [Sphingosinithalassobacter tenebrarum]
MIVYGSTLSPYVRKVAVFAAEKGLDIKIELAGMGRGSPEFFAASPFGKMPAFRDGDFAISDSSAIIAYLEAKHPEPNLIPLRPEARARAIWFEEFADTILMTVGPKIFGNRFVTPRVLNGAPDLEIADTAEREELPKLFDYLESVIPKSEFLVEDRLTLADIAVASPWASLTTVGCAIDGARHPRCAAYFDAILSRPSFAAIVASDHATVAAMGGPVSAEPA